MLLAHHHKSGVCEEGAGGQTDLGIESPQAARLGLLVDMLHQGSTHTAALAFGGAEEVVDIAIGLQIGKASQLTVQLDDKRIHVGHPLLPRLGIQIVRSPGRALLGAVIGPVDGMYGPVLELPQRSLVTGAPTAQCECVVWGGLWQGEALLGCGDGLAAAGARSGVGSMSHTPSLA